MFVNPHIADPLFVIASQGIEAGYAYSQNGIPYCVVARGLAAEALFGTFSPKS